MTSVSKARLRRVRFSRWVNVCMSLNYICRIYNYRSRRSSGHRTYARVLVNHIIGNVTSLTSGIGFNWGNSIYSRQEQCCHSWNKTVWRCTSDFDPEHKIVKVCMMLIKNHEAKFKSRFNQVVIFYFGYNLVTKQGDGPPVYKR